MQYKMMTIPVRDELIITTQSKTQTLFVAGNLTRRSYILTNIDRAVVIVTQMLFVRAGE